MQLAVVVAGYNGFDHIVGFINAPRGIVWI